MPSSFHIFKKLLLNIVDLPAFMQILYPKSHAANYDSKLNQ